MAEQLAHTLAAEFPQYFELRNLLTMASQTWPRFGISAAELSQMSEWQIEMLRVMLKE